MEKIISSTKRTFLVSIPSCLLWEELDENWKRKKRHLKKKEKAIEKERKGNWKRKRRQLKLSSPPPLVSPGKDWCLQIGGSSTVGRWGGGGEVGRRWGGGPENGIFNPPLDCPWQVGEVPRDPLNVTHLVKHAWDAFKNVFSCSSWGQDEYKYKERTR